MPRRILFRLGARGADQVMNQRPISTDDGISIWRAAVDAVDASRLVRNSLGLDAGTDLDAAGAGARWLTIGDDAYDMQPIDRLLIVGAGKAGAAMASGLERAVLELLGQRIGATDSGAKPLELYGLLNIPEGTAVPLRFIKINEARPAGVNEPTERAIEGSREILKLVADADAQVGCIVLLSGGGSALLPLPRPEIGLTEKLEVTRVLSSSGATIDQLNTVRKHLSAIKGGKLALASRAAWMHTLVISDVLGDPLDLIASGPTVPDTSTAADALEILRSFDAQRIISRSVYDVLENASRSPAEFSGVCAHGWPENQSLTVIGNNAVAVDAAGIEAVRLGYNHVMTSARQSEGSAEDLGRHLADMATAMVANLDHDQLAIETDKTLFSDGSPNCLISGGEPVVRLAPAEIRGRGGRNQQLVLAALDRWMQEPVETQQALKNCVTLLSGGTDGEDGPTDAAGALVDHQVWERAETLNLSPADYLRTNNAYAFFEQTGGLLVTGPTGTNVCDVRVLTIRNSK